MYPLGLWLMFLGSEPILAFTWVERVAPTTLPSMRNTIGIVIVVKGISLRRLVGGRVTRSQKKTCLVDQLLQVSHRRPVRSKYQNYGALGAQKRPFRLYSIYGTVEADSTLVAAWTAEDVACHRRPIEHHTQRQRCSFPGCVEREIVAFVGFRSTCQRACSR